MTIVSLPTGLLAKRQDFGADNFDLEFTNNDSGASQAVVNGLPRWTCVLSSDPLLDLDQAALWRSAVLAMRGRVNFLAVYDMLNPAPRGTLRGTLTANDAAAAGASTIRINAGVGQIGKTVKVGDWFGVNQGGTNRQLLHLQQDAVVDSNGFVIITFEPVLRIVVAAGSSIVWDKPTCLMRRDDTTTTWGSEGANQGGFKINLKEHWF